MADSGSQSLLLEEREEGNGQFSFDPLTKNFNRLTAGGIFGQRDYTVEKKHYPWSD